MKHNISPMAVDLLCISGGLRDSLDGQKCSQSFGNIYGGCERKIVSFNGRNVEEIFILNGIHYNYFPYFSNNAPLLAKIIVPFYPLHRKGIVSF